MKKLIALGLLVSSLMGSFIGANQAPVDATQEVVDIEEIKKEIKAEIIKEAKTAGKELSEEELDKAVEDVLKLVMYLSDQQEKMANQEDNA